MNREMWDHPVTRRNLRELQESMAGRLSLLEPVVKELACGEVGPGGLPEPAAIAAALRALLPKRRGTTST
jgi:phosphopantothenoylcysteine decarboxylase/phosphopantothenate--cysteine ligase